MKNVKPKSGQVWKLKHSHNCETVGAVLLDGTVHWGNGKPDYSTVKQLNDYWEFVPQNDLEWLAYDNVKIPNGQKFAYFSNHIDRRVKFCKYIFKDGKTQQEIQNMRYEMGLDERPKHSQGGPIVGVRDVRSQVKQAWSEPPAITGMDMSSGKDVTVKLTVQNLSKDDELYQDDAGTLRIEITKKETKMIDLSKAVVGDKFVLRNDYIAQLVASKPDHGIYVLDLIDDISYVICMSDGMCVITDPNFGTGKQLMRHLDVTSKHDPATG